MIKNYLTLCIYFLCFTACASWPWKYTEDHGKLKPGQSVFSQISDAMEAYWLAAKRGKIGEIYNISGKKVISVGNYLKELKKLSSVKIKCKVDKRLLRPVDVTLQIADTRKFIRDTNWSPKISFKESIKKLLDDCRKL